MRPAAWLLAPVVTLVLGAVPHASLQTASPPSGAKDVDWPPRRVRGVDSDSHGGRTAGKDPGWRYWTEKVALTGGGSIEAVAWKPIRPGWYPSGFYESYKAEIAAYKSTN